MPTLKKLECFKQVPLVPLNILAWNRRTLKTNWARSRPDLRGSVERGVCVLAQSGACD